MFRERKYKQQDRFTSHTPPDHCSAFHGVIEVCGYPDPIFPADLHFLLSIADIERYDQTVTLQPALEQQDVALAALRLKAPGNQCRLVLTQRDQAAIEPQNRAIILELARNIPIFNLVADRDPWLFARKPSVLPGVPAHRRPLRVAIETVTWHEAFKGVTHPLWRNLNVRHADFITGIKNRCTRQGEQ